MDVDTALATVLNHLNELFLLCMAMIFGLAAICLSWLMLLHFRINQIRKFLCEMDEASWLADPPKLEEEWQEIRELLLKFARGYKKDISKGEKAA